MRFLHQNFFLRSVNVGVCVSTGIVFLDWTLPPAPVASGWKVREELQAWTPAGANSVCFKLTGMRDWRFSLCVTGKAKRGKHVNSLELIRFKSSLSWCVSFFGTFCFSFHVGECELVFTQNTCANKDIHLHQYETHVYDFWSQLLPLKEVSLFFRGILFSLFLSSLMISASNTTMYLLFSFYPSVPMHSWLGNFILSVFVFIIRISHFFQSQIPFQCLCCIFW